MRHGQIKLEGEQSARLLSWGIRFFLAAALTASQTPGGYAPFALAAWRRRDRAPREAPPWWLRGRGGAVHGLCPAAAHHLKSMPLTSVQFTASDYLGCSTPSAATAAL